MPSVVAFGELMLRLTTPGVLRFGQAGHFEATFAGAEANVAVAIAQLGGKAEFVSKLPANELGDRAVDELRARRVGVESVARGGDRIGLLFFEHGVSQRPGKVVYDRAHSAFAEAGPAEFNWRTILQDAKWLHWSGITPALSSTAAQITAEAVSVARELGLTISFDLNYRSKLWTMEEAGAVLRPLMKSVDICVCGPEEARSILGATGGDAETVARDLQQRFGFSRVAMTHREASSASTTGWSAQLFEGQESYLSRSYEIAIVDRLGAGDCFTGALIFSLMRGDAPSHAIEFAAAAGALKHTIAGDYAIIQEREVQALLQGATGGRVQR